MLPTVAIATLHAAGAAGSAIGAITSALPAVVAGAGAAASTTAGYAADVIAPRLSSTQCARDYASTGAAFLSPTDVGSLSLAGEASTASTVPSTPSDSRRRDPSPEREQPIHARCTDQPPYTPTLDIAFIVRRLKEPPLTGQVAAWAWGEAAAVSLAKRTPNVALLAALWPNTEACAAKFTPEDVVDMLEAWMVLLQQWPRHFHLPAGPMDTLTAIAFPAAVKRMDDARLVQLSQLCRDLALHCPAEILLHGTERTRSARDLMQPVFALVAAEVAWRVADPARRASAATVSIVLHASPAWRWTAVRHVDPPQLATLKEATRAALEVLQCAAARTTTKEGGRM